MSAQYLKNIEFEKKLELSSLVQYQEGQVMSRTLAQNPAVNITLFSSGREEEINTHSSDGDVMVTVLRGGTQIIIDGQVHPITQGQAIVMPAGTPHAAAAEKLFKMPLTVVFPYPRN